MSRDLGGNIINETSARRKYNEQEAEKGIDSNVYKTPSNVLNNAYREVMSIWKSGKNLNEQLDEFVKLYNDSKEDIKKVDHNKGNWCRCEAKRLFVNLQRMCKRAYQAQDFSYACYKYRRVFSLLDTSKKENEITK